MMGLLELSPDQASIFFQMKQGIKRSNDALRRDRKIQTDQKIISMLKKGKHPMYIASECNCSYVTVYKMIKKLKAEGIEVLGGCSEVC